MDFVTFIADYMLKRYEYVTVMLLVFFIKRKA